MNLRSITIVSAVSLVVGALSGCQSSPGKVLPNSAEARITEGAIASDLNYLEGLQARIKRLNDTGSAPVYGYGLAKAQCWLNFALAEYHENDRTGVIEDAASASLALIAALEQHQPIDTATPTIASSTRLREDLWGRIDTIKKDPRFAPPFSCANAVTACLEVTLIEAGHDYNETGWRHARAALGEAEQMLAAADAELATCGAGSTSGAANSVADEGDGDRDGVSDRRDRCPTTPPGTRVDADGCELKDQIRLTRVNFRNNSALMTRESKPALDDAIATLKRYPTLVIEVQGHTDARAADDYNQRLSQLRADAVVRALRSSGVTNQLTAKGYGESQPIATNDTDEGRAQNRRVVLKIVE